MRRKQRGRGLVALAALVAVAAVCARGTGAQAQNPAAWTPDKALVEQLAAEEGQPGFALRPPKGYQLARQKQGAGEGFAWAGPARADGTRPMLMVVVFTAPAGEQNRYTPEQALEKMMASVAGRRQDFSRTPTEQGTVNGVPFVRARWKATEPTRARKMQGFVYAAVDGPRIFQLWSQDVEPGADAALKLAEASLLTFRKK